MPDSQSREPWFESSLCYRLEDWAFSFSPRCLSSISCINKYLAIDGGRNASEYTLRVIAAFLECFQKKPSWCRNEQVCQGRISVKRFEPSSGLDTALYKNIHFFTRVVLFSEGSVISQNDLIEAVKKLNFSRVNIMFIQINVTMVMKIVPRHLSNDKG